MKFVKLMDMVVDPAIQVRDICAHTVGKYADAMRAGAVFPPLVLDAATMRIVCGNTRFTAYKRVYDPDHEVAVELMEFKDDAAIIRFAAKDNSTHGQPMAPWDQKRVMARLREHGDSLQDIASVLGVTVNKLERWAGMEVMVVGAKPKSQMVRMPIKAGLEHMAGQKMKADDYRAHSEKDYGTPIKNFAAQITRHIEAGLIPVNDAKTMDNLRKLHDALTVFFKKAGVAA